MKLLISLVSTLVLGGDDARLVVELQARAFGERIFNRLDPDVDEIELYASLTIAIALDTVCTVWNALIAFEMAFSTC
jgi:hypothetical protein